VAQQRGWYIKKRPRIDWRRLMERELIGVYAPNTKEPRIVALMGLDARISPEQHLIEATAVSAVLDLLHAMEGLDRTNMLKGYRSLRRTQTMATRDALRAMRKARGESDDGENPK
jgi:hypothetical protein